MNIGRSRAALTDFPVTRRPNYRLPRRERPALQAQPLRTRIQVTTSLMTHERSARAALPLVDTDPRGSWPRTFDLRLRGWLKRNSLRSRRTTGRMEHEVETMSRLVRAVISALVVLLVAVLAHSRYRH